MGSIGLDYTRDDRVFDKDDRHSDRRKWIHLNDFRPKATNYVDRGEGNENTFLIMTRFCF